MRTCVKSYSLHFKKKGGDCGITCPEDLDIGNSEAPNSQPTLISSINLIQPMLILGHFCSLKYLIMDEYENDLGRPTTDKHTFGYRQIQFRTCVTIRVHRSLGMTRDVTEILAIVPLCWANGEDTARGTE